MFTVYNHIRKVVIIVVLLLNTIVFGQSESLFQKANELYNQENYQEAIDTYVRIIDEGQESASLYYNMANSYYKLSQIGPSIYYYEKALGFAPDDEDIKNNLTFAQNATIDAIDVIPEGIITRTMNTLTNLFTFDTWAWISVLSVLVFVILFILYHKAYTSSKKRLFFVSSWAVLILGIFGIFFAFRQYDLIENNQYAIVFVQEAVVKSAPNLKSEEVFELHEGTKVKITETVNDWKKIKLTDGKIGWIPATDIKEL